MIAFLSSKKAFYFLFALCIILRSLFEINNPKLTSDHSIQLSAAKNYLENGTLSTSQTTADDLAKTYYTPLQLWPVGLAIFSLAFNVFTDDLICSNICFQVLGILLFITGMIALFRKLNLSLLIVNLFLLLYAFNPSPFTYLGSTDLFTAALFLWIAYFTIKESETPVINLGNIAAISILAFLAATLRFACIPNIAIVPFFFLIAGLILKNKKHFVRAALITILSVIFVFVFYKIFPIDNSRTSFVDSIRNGNFYFNHLQWFDAFPLKSFLFTRPVEFHLPSKPMLILFYRLIIQIISFSLLVFLIMNFVPALNIKRWVTKMRNNCSVQDLYLILVLSTICVVAGFISLQSVTIGPENNSFGPAWMPPLWTFVYATRYFIYPMVLIIVLFFMVFNFRIAISSMQRNILTLSYILFFAWSILYWAFINFQFYSPSGNGASSAWVNEKNAIAAYKIINQLKENDPNNSIVYSHHTNATIKGLVTNYANATPTDDYLRIIKNDFANSRPITLILTMPIARSAQEEEFLNTHSHEIMSTFDREEIVKINLK